MHTSPLKTAKYTMANYSTVMPALSGDLDNTEHEHVIANLKMLMQLAQPKLMEQDGVETKLGFVAMTLFLANHPDGDTYDENKAFPGFSKQKNGEWVVYKQKKFEKHAYFAMCEGAVDAFKNIERQFDCTLYVASCRRKDCCDARRDDTKLQRDSLRHLHVLLGMRENRVQRAAYPFAAIRNFVAAHRSEISVCTFGPNRRHFVMCNPYVFLALTRSSGNLCSVITGNGAQGNGVMSNLCSIQAEAFHEYDMDKKSLNYAWTTYSFKELTETNGHCMRVPFVDTTDGPTHEGGEDVDRRTAVNKRKRAYVLSLSDMLPKEFTDVAPDNVYVPVAKRPTPVVRRPAIMPPPTPSTSAAVQFEDGPSSQETFDDLFKEIVDSA